MVLPHFGSLGYSDWLLCLSLGLVAVSLAALQKWSQVTALTHESAARLCMQCNKVVEIYRDAKGGYVCPHCGTHATFAIDSEIACAWFARSRASGR